MAEDSKNRMPCGEFDSLLSDALEGTLGGAQLEKFQAHASSCPTCGPVLKEAEIGRQWLHALQEVDPPDDLMANILIATTGVRPGRAHAAGGGSWWQRLVGTVILPVLEVARQPRFAMSFGMAFFSLSLTMNLAGVKLSDIRHVDLRPSAVKRSYYEASGRVVKYYENIRFVYEIESRVREFKRLTAPAEPAQQPKPKDRKDKDDSSQQQEQPRQERNYSQGENQPVLAHLPDDPPVVTGNAHRRLV